MWPLLSDHSPRRMGYSMTQLDIVDNGLVSISLSTAEILGLPQLTTLPSEVLQLIRAYSRGSFIWTYPAIKAKAEEMARFHESMSKDDDMQYNLRIVKEWHRGQDAELDEDPPESDATCNRTLDLRNITGITFFYYQGILMGLHAHTHGTPTAVSTVEDVLSDYKPHLVWIYIPIPHGDRIMRFGLRTWRNEHEEPANHHTALLMTTKLAGDFSLGPDFDVQDQNFLFQGTPTVLVHNTPEKGGVTLLGLAGDEPQETLPAPRFPIIFLSPDQLTYGGNAITVDISLKGAVRIDIFRDSSTGYLRGFLLDLIARSISSAAGQDDSQFCMLDKVESWTREDGAPVISDSTAELWGVLVTIDRRGIRKLERLFGLPSYASWRSESFAYALIGTGRARASSVSFRFGSSRIKLSGDGKSIMWDTPSPPLSGGASPRGHPDRYLYLQTTGPCKGFATAMRIGLTAVPVMIIVQRGLNRGSGSHA
ncbi:hypothetical protein LZL87_005419 [Fusarium oxysporum]|nr:hypothetical protein LZL87_005419 [Fusarium oxysporum]